jgi:malate permease and related proteins
VNEFATVFGAVVPVLGLMVVGFILRRVKWLTQEADQSLLRISVNVLLPALIFENVLGNTALRQVENLVFPPLVGVVTTLTSLGLAWFAARWAGLTEPRARRTFALTAGLHNYAYVPLPLCLMLFDSRTVGVLLVHNVGVEITLWTVGVAVLSGRSLAGNWRRAINAPLLALALALGLNFIGSHFGSPECLALPVKLALTSIHWLAQSAIPLALIMIGAIVAEYFPDLHGGQFFRVASVAIAVRLVIMPVLFLLLARYLPWSLELKRVIIVQGAMASAVLPIALTKHYGGDPRIALQTVLSTTFAGLLTIPFWIRLGSWWCGV